MLTPYYVLKASNTIGRTLPVSMVQNSALDGRFVSIGKERQCVKQYVSTALTATKAIEFRDNASEARGF